MTGMKEIETDTYTFRIPRFLLAKMKAQAGKEGRKPPEWLRELIRAELANKRADGPKNAIGGTHS